MCRISIYLSIYIYFLLLFQIVELDVDVPDGMTPEQAQAMFASQQEQPIFKALWESPDGTYVEVPRGMNLADMVEAGLIPPLDQGAEEAREDARSDGASAAGSTTLPRGVFDPSAVRGAEERSKEVSNLYAKVMKNKQRARQEAQGGRAEDNSSPAANVASGGNGGDNSNAGHGVSSSIRGETTPSTVGLPAAAAVNGYVANDGHGGGAESGFGDVFRLGSGAGEEGETGRWVDGGEHAASNESVASGVGEEVGGDVRARHVDDNEGNDGKYKEQKDMVGYDFILQHRDGRGEEMTAARAAMR